MLIDEAESNEREDQQRIQAILALARVASSESRAAIVKGSPAGEVARYSVRSMFLLSSIATGLKQGADRRRFAPLNLRNPSELPQQQREAREHRGSGRGIRAARTGTAPTPTARSAGPAPS